VTRGLDLNVKLKPSGVEWLGDIPEHWDVLPLRWHIQISSGEFRAGDLIKTHKSPEFSYPVIGGNGILGYTNSTNSENATIVIGRVGALCGNVHLVPEPAWITDNALRIAKIKRFNIEYLMYQLRTMNLNRLSNANAQPLVTGGVIKAQKVACPTYEEQMDILKYIEKESKIVDIAISNAQREIDLIREYRIRLIADVVTGKVDVRGIAVERKKPAKVIQFPKKKEQADHKANVYFKRAVFAAEIVARLHKEPTFGHVKFQKLIFLCEKKCGVDIGSTYFRQAAGPYDNRALRSIDSQMKKQQWYAARRIEGRYRYTPLPKAGGHKSYFDRYFADIEKEFSNIIETFRKLDTERCEIVATLYSAWEDLLKDDPRVSDERIVREVLTNWHESKKRIAWERWEKALNWMRQNGFVPVISGKSRKADE
jgi:hypothetical protein